MKKPENITLGELMRMLSSDDPESINRILVYYKREWDRLMQENAKMNRLLAAQAAPAQGPSDVVSDSVINPNASAVSGGETLAANPPDTNIADAASAEIGNMGRSPYNDDINIVVAGFSTLGEPFYDISHADRTFLSGSEDLFATYLGPREAREIYDTSPAITRSGFGRAGAVAKELEEKSSHYYS